MEDGGWKMEDGGGGETGPLKLPCCDLPPVSILHPRIHSSSGGTCRRLADSDQASTYWVWVGGAVWRGKKRRPMRKVRRMPATRMTRMTAQRRALVAVMAWAPCLSPCFLASRKARSTGRR